MPSFRMVFQEGGVSRYSANTCNHCRRQSLTKDGVLSRGSCHKSQEKQEMLRPGILHPDHEIAQPMWSEDRLVLQHNMVFCFTIADCWEVSGGHGSCVLSLVWSLGGRRGWGERERATHNSQEAQPLRKPFWGLNRGSCCPIPTSRIPFVLLSSLAVSSWKDRLQMMKWVHQSQLLSLSFSSRMAPSCLKGPLLKAETAEAAQIP